MKIYLLLFGTSLMLLCCQPAKQDPQSKEPASENSNTMSPTSPATDYLHVPGPIDFNQKEYLLNWSSHPSENYYKHEYLSKGESEEDYHQMIMLEVALGDLVPLEIAKGKANEIEGRKSTDAMANYTLSENKKTGEVLLDFMLSEGTGDNSTVEWNCYRYKSYVGPTGQKGIMLLGLSKRGYGTAGKTFASDINSNRQKYVTELEALNFPQVKL